MIVSNAGSKDLALNLGPKNVCCLKSFWLHFGRWNMASALVSGKKKGIDVARQRIYVET